MLQKINFEAQARDEDLKSYEDEVDRSYLLRPGFYWELVKRRWILFVIPVVPILVVGLAIAALWPATYLSEGKILVQSQLIPTELVRPTVTNAAQERIQVIEQRVMTRGEFARDCRQVSAVPDPAFADVAHSTGRCRQEEREDRAV